MSTTMQKVFKGTLSKVETDIASKSNDRMLAIMQVQDVLYCVFYDSFMYKIA